MKPEKKEETKDLKHAHTFMVEGKEFEWSNQFITGAEIKKIAKLHKEAKLYLVVVDPWDDELINDGTQVNLARPEIEQFVIKKK
ncbi:MAG: multiubiquitin domain-containing protein [Chitinophagaceae bacterium]|nr:multiubiquitin domain-containing protein [Chitinophagaceae bacterium]